MRRKSARSERVAPNSPAARTSLILKIAEHARAQPRRRDQRLRTAPKSKVERLIALSTLALGLPPSASFVRRNIRAF
jgi:hypothetical protein